MNILDKIDLWFKSDDKLDYKKRKRKMQAEELEIEKHAKRVAYRLGETDHSPADVEKNYLWKQGEVEVERREKTSLSTSETTLVRYKGETVYRSNRHGVKEFKPCGWIDTVLTESEKLRKAEEEEEKERKKDKWGLDRECDSKIFNQIYGE